ncbi:MAG: DNA repair exonuclease [Corynebacterium sp.]|uniref:metallophosphoesterase family protein n=1 Tax=Corynebacterium sp. TaxID=1720 RepID=UPI0026DAA240|nr:DNA repair exonuclease [Corynebacterium sp.]MDO5029429.1 DNA repair exonuclease [Corynebacterium sp.]
MKFIHTSDWQLGMTRWFLELDGGEAQARFNESRLDAIDRIGELATSEDAEFIVVAGDVFDSNTLPEKVFLRALDRIAKLPVPVYLLPGNHDALDASSIYRRKAFESLEQQGVYVLRDTNPIAIREGVELVGVPVRGKYSADDIVAEAAAELEPTDGIRVMVAHGQVEGFGDEGGATIDLASLEHAIERGALHYVALGDSHSTSQLDGSGRVFFSGAHETTAYDDKERGSGNVLVVDIAESGPDRGEVTVVPHRVGKWSFHAIDMHISSAEDVDAFFAELDGIESKTDTAVKYSLRGTVTLSESTKFESRLERYQQLFAALYRRGSGSDLTVVPSEGDIANLNLTGYPLQAAEKLSEISKGRTETGVLISEADATAAADALRLLARLVGEKE